MMKFILRLWRLPESHMYAHMNQDSVLSVGTSILNPSFQTGRRAKCYGAG